MRLIALIFAMLALPVSADDYSLGGISVMHPVAFETTGRTGAGYFTVENAGADDRLIQVRADFPRVMMHETIQEDGIAKMQHVEAVQIPKDGAVTFEPGGLHIMFMGLSAHWEAGDKIAATLVFERAGAIDVVFNVEPRPGNGTENMDHSELSGN